MRMDVYPDVSKSALICIDMQNDFCLPTAPLCVQGAMECLPNVEKAIEFARSRQIPIIWVIREHHPTGCDVESFRRHLFLNGPGATVRGTDGAELVGEQLDIRPEDHVISKKRFSAFMYTHLENLLKHGLGIGHLILCGVQTPNCIRATAMDAVAMDFPRVTVLEDATASATRQVQDANIFDMKNIGVEIMLTRDWIANTNI
jgi:nicotinamidase-related amidase